MQVPHILTELNIISILVRLLLALLFGGMIGLERGANRHQAGFRTHILVCAGAALAMMTNQYIFDAFAQATDPARIGAQVITGVGFLGAGTILVTGRTRIKGLTTAAGLWASACLGLAIGIGFYEGAILGGILIFISLALLPGIENFFYQRSGVVNLYFEVMGIEYVRRILEEVRRSHLVIQDLNLNQAALMTKEGTAFTLTIRHSRDIRNEELVDRFSELEGVVIVDEI